VKHEIGVNCIKNSIFNLRRTQCFSIIKTCLL